MAVCWTDFPIFSADIDKMRDKKLLILFFISYFALELFH